MKFTVSSTLCAAACLLASDFAPASMALAAKPAGGLRTLEWGGPDGGHNNGGPEGDKGHENGREGDNKDHDNKDNEHDKDHDERDRDEHDERDRDEHDERDRDEHDERDRDEQDRREEEDRDKEDERDREEQERRQEEEEERRQEEREREEGRFDCPPDRPWLCAPTVGPTFAPSFAPTLAPTFLTTTSVGIFGSGVFGSGNISQDAEIGLALGIAICVCGAFLAVFVVAYRYDMHKILAMKVLRSDSQGFNPRMHEQGTAIDISSRDDVSSRGGESVTGLPVNNDPEWGVAASGAIEPKKSRKSRSGKTIDF